MQNVIQIALEYQFFFKALQKIAQRLGALPQDSSLWNIKVTLVYSPSLPIYNFLKTFLVLV